LLLAHLAVKKLFIYNNIPNGSASRVDMETAEATKLDSTRPKIARSTLLSWIVAASLCFPFPTRGFSFAARHHRRTTRTDFTVRTPSFDRTLIRRKILDDGNDLDTRGSYSLTVSYESESCIVTVHRDETILSALERQSLKLRKRLTALPEMPADCRRGNCLTCAAFSPTQNSQHGTQMYVRGEDGLSPHMSKLVRDEGYILTCSTYLHEDGLHLQLNEHHNVWNLIYKSPGRFATASAQLAASSAMAKAIRKSAERNVAEWARQTEQVLKETHE
jgi:ferredoxin